MTADCTGTSYLVNPDHPEEGSDVHHAGPCPAHPDAFTLELAELGERLAREHTRLTTPLALGPAIDAVMEAATALEAAPSAAGREAMTARLLEACRRLGHAHLIAHTTGEVAK